MKDKCTIYADVRSTLVFEAHRAPSSSFEQMIENSGRETCLGSGTARQFSRLGVLHVWSRRDTMLQSDVSASLFVFLLIVQSCPELTFVAVAFQETVQLCTLSA